MKSETTTRNMISTSSCVWTVYHFLLPSFFIIENYKILKFKQIWMYPQPTAVSSYDTTLSHTSSYDTTLSHTSSYDTSLSHTSSYDTTLSHTSSYLWYYTVTHF